MIYCDTNILIRLITNDIPSLRLEAERLLARRSFREVFIPDIVFCELFFVLAYNPRYKLPRKTICSELSKVLQRPQLDFTSQASQALLLAANKPGLDFTDCLLAIYAEQRSDQLLTLDKDLLKILA